MKPLLIICLGIWMIGVAAAQEKPCPRGKVRGGGIASTSMAYLPGCYTPRQKKKLDLAFAENICLETQSFFGDSDFAYSDRHTWKGDRCETVETYEKRVGEEWIKISEAEYMRGTCTKMWRGDEQVYPKPEWTECKP